MVPIVSRGPGRVMRATLAAVEARDGITDAYEVASAIYKVHPAADGRTWLTPAQVVAVRRALAQLVRLGKVRDLGRGWRDGRRRYASPDAAAHYGARVQALFGQTDRGS